MNASCERYDNRKVYCINTVTHVDSSKHEVYVEVAKRTTPLSLTMLGICSEGLPWALAISLQLSRFGAAPTVDCGKGRVEDIGAAVVFMASPAASWITGQCLYVDGGI